MKRRAKILRVADRMHADGDTGGLQLIWAAMVAASSAPRRAPVDVVFSVYLSDVAKNLPWLLDRAAGQIRRPA